MSSLCGGQARRTFNRPAKRSGFIGPQPRGQIVEDRERDVVVTARHRGFTHAGPHGKTVTVCQLDELVGVCAHDSGCGPVGRTKNAFGLLMSLNMLIETPAGFELNRQKVASDPMVRTFLQGWRTMLAGNAEVDVYEDVSGE